MTITTQQFVTEHDGDYVFIPGYNSAECVALFWAFNKEVGKAEAYSAPGAYNLWTTTDGDAYIWNTYDRITGELRYGDWVIWSGVTGPLQNSGSGHVAMFVSDNGDGTAQFFSQNPGPARAQRITLAGVVGALRLKSAAPKPTPAPMPTAPAPKPTPKPATLTLPATATSWSVYPLNKQPVKANAIGTLYPSKFGGLTYPIERWTQKDVAVIRTRDYGLVQIYVAPSTGARIK